MPFDDAGMEGKGALEEYFTPKTWATEQAGDASEMFSAIDRLQLQLFTEFSGLDKSEEIEIFWPETKRELRSHIGKRSGLVLIGWQMDDPIMALYKNGTPIAAFYASYRGIYQAGAFVVASDTYYFAHDFLDGLPKDEWIADYKAVCGEIAADFLMGQY